MGAVAATWAIAGLATLGVIVRPFSWPEAVWAVLGAALLVGLQLLPAGAAWDGVRQGTDVYLFLVGMMLLSEVARREGLFDWLAALATAHARGSALRLLVLVYGVGVVVTVFLSNDATAVVLTPAVYAATRVARVSAPLPYILSCAFVANAASFVLPISNPANLVVFAGRMPRLGDWLATFALPSLLSIAATFALLWATQRRSLARETIAGEGGRPALTRAGRIAAAGIVGTAAALIGASASGVDLGAPTLAMGALTAAAILAVKREAPFALLGGVAWGVLPLVAGLFVLVAALDRTGVVPALAAAMREAARAAPRETAAGAGVLVAFVTNAVNNLPAGLLAGTALRGGDLPGTVPAAVLIGVDLGPNLSVTGSLATILWLAALRREGQRVGALEFLKLGAVVMPPALLLALAGLFA